MRYMANSAGSPLNNHSSTISPIILCWQRGETARHFFFFSFNLPLQPVPCGKQGWTLLGEDFLRDSCGRKHSSSLLDVAVCL